ncbi:MAG: class I SAM-dependent methyltransferase [Thiohalocapsa sp. PB-PSB1]|jgi:predicted TPR repeat methyltransferase|nr:MAG: hypothetical protein N838_25725 [Thiohalocapsa sp. PB-PSB1]QQO56965.1 MAG: class I SAM-dependent methyltransferase [Thiohalocapsa sp. PB-PSB1]HCS89819.1 class I SAM-dependent methyltransferase [Chromatiaceae bacterium]
MADNPARLNWQASSPDELKALYDRWSENYDADLDRLHGYRVPAVAAEALARHVARDAAILDLGAGTGLVGQVLAGLGYRNLIALDASDGMLAQARRKGVYREALVHKIGTDSAPGCAFDAVIAVGLFGPTHVPAAQLAGLVRWLATRGGHFVFTLREEEYAGAFARAMDALSASGAWRLIETLAPFQGLPRSEPERLFLGWVFEVTTRRRRSDLRRLAARDAELP